MDKTFTYKGRNYKVISEDQSFIFSILRTFDIELISKFIAGSEINPEDDGQLDTLLDILLRGEFVSEVIDPRF